MRFLKPIGLLLAIRRRAAMHEFSENPGAYMARGFLAVGLALAAGVMGLHESSVWQYAPPATAVASLQRLLAEMQAFWIAGLLAPGAISLLGRTPPEETLRSYSLQPKQRLAAEMMALLIDTPTAIAILLLAPFVAGRLICGAGLEAAAAAIASALLALQTAAFALLLRRFSGAVWRRLRGWAQIPAMTALFLIALTAFVPPAFASLITARESGARPASPDWSIRMSLRPGVLLPTEAAADLISEVRLGHGGAACLHLLAVAGYAGVTLGGTALTFREGANARALRLPTRRPAAVRRSAISSERTGLWAQFAALATYELRLLFRSPNTYLPLRQPAALLLVGTMAFLAPDMHAKDPVYNLKELLGLAGVLYNVLWQIQLLCNRFGSENQTATLLFSLSVPRWMLIVGKNFALLAALLVLDSAALSGLMLVAERTQFLGTALLILALVLPMLTAIGNIFSVVAPFCIARSEAGRSLAVPDTLSVGYILAGVCSGFLVWLIWPRLSAGIPGWCGVALLWAALYSGSVYAAALILRRSEARLIARLDGRE